ncbi:MAG: ATPase [Bacteroidales bacterium]|nr:ATPase [Bacteroidales bacterium]
MNILIADSGSTKTTWALVDKQVGQPAFVQLVQTQGLNPLYASSDAIAQAARTVVEQTGDRYPDLVQFYGSGCSGERIALVEGALRRVFTPQTRIEVASDLLCACRALFPTGAGIGCILGTGAIAARYDAASGEMNAASSLGYILGDEGSGAWLGRQVLADYLKEQMPQRVRTLFEADYGTVTAEQAIQRVYRGEFPNRYLATFASFVGRHFDVSYCQKLAYDGIDAFFVRNILRLQPSPTEPISFVGSVAFHLQVTIRTVALMRDLTIGKIVQNPLELLINN